MGTNDVNGVYIYDEGDEFSPVSEFENKGQRSISAAIGKLKDGIEALTGIKPSPWVNVTFASGWSQHPNTAQWGNVQYRTTAGAVELRGQIVPRAGYGVDETMFTLPVAARPEYTMQFPITNNSTAAAYAGIVIRADGRVQLSATGALNVNLGLVRFPQKGY